MCGIYVWDFKSLASAYSATPADASHIYINVRMDGGGFEPPKQIAADLQSVPFGHSGIHPYGIVFHKADDRTRTDNLLITNQLLCQLSHIGLLQVLLASPPILISQELNRLMDGEGFEPSKALPTDLQSAPFGHSGIHP